ncbi:hypothetical protein CLF_106313 [Clonorchis sinensis]|uniref:Uncharacterized protein n=1 Tax=Clonorchis sinensis TaxID=79923 RepID=G7YPW3_CLOSI|nr:hypothetical protein CLF_106313 [Clonorchis sinensis]
MGALACPQNTTGNLAFCFQRTKLQPSEYSGHRSRPSRITNKVFTIPRAFSDGLDPYLVQFYSPDMPLRLLRSPKVHFADIYVQFASVLGCLVLSVLSTIDDYAVVAMRLLLYMLGVEEVSQMNHNTLHRTKRELNLNTRGLYGDDINTNVRFGITRTMETIWSIRRSYTKKTLAASELTIMSSESSVTL